MIVVDTNVVAYLVIEGEKTQAARNLWATESSWVVPNLLKYEFLNVLSTYCRHGGMALKEAEMLLRSIDQTLELAFSETDSLESLQLAVENNISAYDAHFISLAKTIGVPLVTADKKLISTFPQIAVPLSKWS